MEIIDSIELEVDKVKGEIYRYTERNEEGIYLLLNQKHRVLYVGKGKLRERINSHLKAGNPVAHNFHYIRILYIKNKNDLSKLESLLIDSLNPIFNIVRRFHLIKGLPTVYHPRYNQKNKEYGIPEWIQRRYGQPEPIEDNEFEKGYTIGFEEGYEAGYNFILEQQRLNNI
jgi:hypothetical protein